MLLANSSRPTHRITELRRLRKTTLIRRRRDVIQTAYLVIQYISYADSHVGFVYMCNLECERDVKTKNCTKHKEINWRLDKITCFCSCNCLDLTKVK